jgi:mono/diheme cytochrome c family protein
MSRDRWRLTGKVLAAIVGAGLLALVLALASILRRGVSTRDEPALMEEVLARSMRHLAARASLRAARNPVPLTTGVLAEGRAHWADHCAGCHGNDGTGRTEMGRGLYPKPPDMRQPATQGLTDGEIFAIIRNGVRLTGMPAWGDPGGRDDAETWKLVHFIRHLPKLTPEEIAEMEKLNPKSPEERQEERDEAAFLAGGEPPAPPPPRNHTHH